MASILLKEKRGYGQSREGDLWECKIYKGEFIVRIYQEEIRQIKGVTPNYRLYRDPEVVLYAEPVDAAPLEEREIEYLLAVNPPSLRLKEYLNEEDKKMKMDLVVGDKVIFKLENAPRTLRTSTASVNGTIRYIGPHPDSDGIVFGVEIDVRDQAYRGKGTSNGRPYFTCGPKNAVFVAMDKIFKKQDPPPHTRSSQQLSEPPVTGQPRPNTRSQTKPGATSSQQKPVTSGQPKPGVYDKFKGFVKDAVSSWEGEEEGVRFEVGDVPIPGHVSKFKEGDRVIIQTVKEEVVAGTVKWVGPVRVAKDMKVDPIPVVGIETDYKMEPSKDFDGVDINVTGSHGTKLFAVAHNHSRVFLPEQMVLFVKEYTMQQQKDNAARFKQSFKKETEQNDATEEKKIAADFGMSVAEYRQKQRDYVAAVKQRKDDRNVPDNPKTGDESNKEQKSAGGGMKGGGGRGDELTDTIQAMKFPGPEVVDKERVEKEERALEEMKTQCLKEEIHQLQTSIKSLQLEKDTQQRRAEQQEQQWRNEKQQLLEEQEHLREEVKQVQEQLETDKQRLKKENGQLKYKNGQLKYEIGQLQYENEDLRRQITDLREAHHELQQETEKKEQVQAQLQSQVGLFSIENMRLKGQVKQLEESSATDIKYWEVNYKQVLTNKDTLGSGGWGKVEVGLLHGQKVAVKMLHSDIKSPYYNQLVRREISMLAKVRHPNLLLFIAGVLDHPSGSPIIITELLDTSLRKAYTDRLIGSDRVRISIMRDVAAALNYIHCQKESIIHRDVSSANVLLESRGEGNWKAKLSDFGSANLVQFSTTVGPGAIPYAAPEVPHNQTTKMDVYSYGVLLCEVMLSEFPFKERFPDMLQSLAGSWSLIHQLILSCTRHSVADRVDMMYVLDTFNENFTDVSVKGFVPLV